MKVQSEEETGGPGIKKESFRITRMIFRRFGVIAPLQLKIVYLTNLLEVSIGRDLGALKGLTPSQLETLLGDKTT